MQDFLTLGALLSISGSDEAGILSSARIPYAMAADGLLPRVLAKVHPKYGTPYVALIVQSIVTLIAAIFGTIESTNYSYQCLHYYSAIF